MNAHRPILYGEKGARPSIHGAHCKCRDCRRFHRDVADRRAQYAPAYRRARLIRTVMFTLAIVIGGTLGHLFTPQAIAAAVAAAF